MLPAWHPADRDRVNACPLRARSSCAGRTWTARATRAAAPCPARARVPGGAAAAVPAARRALGSSRAASRGRAARRSSSRVTTIERQRHRPPSARADPTADRSVADRTQIATRARCGEVAERSLELGRAPSPHAAVRARPPRRGPRARRGRSRRASDEVDLARLGRDADRGGCCGATPRRGLRLRDAGEHVAGQGAGTDALGRLRDVVVPRAAALRPRARRAPPASGGSGRVARPPRRGPR